MRVLFFVFKQKTAYEMRISDWSSDVCSSDLAQPALHRLPNLFPGERQLPSGPGLPPPSEPSFPGMEPDLPAIEQPDELATSALHTVRSTQDRSEEHTSELQSLMRSSYAVFCLKKKKLARNEFSTNATTHTLTEARR